MTPNGVRARPPGGSNALPVLLALVYGAITGTVLLRGFPHEDAYILFKYARDLGRGAGIVFYPGGPHAEGATDFLWMLALAGGCALHLDPAVAAAVLDTAAFYVCARIFVRALSPVDAAPRLPGPLVAATALLLLTPCAVAGYVGFGSMVYATLALVLYRAYLDGQLERLPLLGLALGLTRPDGVVLAASFVLLAWPLARARGRVASYGGACAVCAALGAAYFVWRWRYFHALLPLPLYVKTHFAGVPGGVSDTRDWLLSTLLPVGGLAVGARLVFGRVSVRAMVERRAWLGLAPFVLHVGSFVFTTSSQNVANRFQSPAALVVFYFVLAQAAARARATAQPPLRAWAFVALSATLFVPQALIAADVLRGSLAPQYVDVFAWWLGRTGGRALRIASTEAGRMLYWTDGPVLDLVGLSSPETARTPPTRELLGRFDPDVVMLHPAGSLDEDRMEAGRSGDVLRLDQPLESYFRPGVAPLAAGDLPPYDALHLPNVQVAPIATLGWLASLAASGASGPYELYAVRFKARSARFHVYAIRASLPQKDAIVAELATSHVLSAGASHVALVCAAF